MEMAQDCNQRKFGTRLSASIHPFRTGLFATETAIIRLGLQSTALGPHSMRLTGTTVFGLSLCERETHASLENALEVLLSRTSLGQWCKGAMILCTIGLLQFCHQGGHLCSVPCLKDLWKKARSPSWSALHSSACWAPIASICGMSAPRRSNIPETSCFPASMI